MNRPALLRADRLDPSLAMVLVIDVQIKLLPMIHDPQRVIASTRRLLDATRIFDLPVLATEQYPAGIGATHEHIAASLHRDGAVVVEKSTFSAVCEPAVRSAFDAMNRPQVIVAGIEAHVCVQQSVLDLLSMGCNVFVCVDAIGSRSVLDCDVAVQRMGRAGTAVTTVESVLFELCGRCDTPRFKELLPIIKDSPSRG